MASGDRSEGGAGGPRAEAVEAEPPEEVELSSRGRIVVRSSSHPPGDRTPFSDPPSVAGGQARPKRDTPAERPRGRRAARALVTEPGDTARSFDGLGVSATAAVQAREGAARRGALVLWAVVAAVVAALAYALLR